MKKAIALLSGGLDSAVTLYFAKRKGYRVSCLAFDYGQRHQKEITCAKKIAKAANCRLQIIKISLPWKGSSLLNKKLKLPNAFGQAPMVIPSTYVPARNTIFLSFAVSFAEASGAGAIFIGAHAQDYSGYPDCRPQFLRAFNRVICLGTKTGVEKKALEVKAPLIHKTKAQIIKLGSRLKVPFELTWSCYHGGMYPCGICDSCQFRAKGFKEALLQDPLI